MDPAYLESRVVLPRNLTIILTLVLLATWAFMTGYKYLYYPDIPDAAIIGSGIVFIIGCAICFLWKFSITVYDDRIEMKYAFMTTSIPKEQIIDTRVGELNIIKNYSDWTLKGVKYKTFSAIGEDMGIGLKVTGKRVFFMSTTDPEAIAALLPKEKKEAD